jgi:hypothetical protein
MICKTCNTTKQAWHVQTEEDCVQCHNLETEYYHFVLIDKVAVFAALTLFIGVVLGVL